MITDAGLIETAKIVAEGFQGGCLILAGAYFLVRLFFD